MLHNIQMHVPSDYLYLHLFFTIVVAGLEEGAPSTYNTFVSAVVICKSNIGRKKTFYIILNLSFLSFPTRKIDGTVKMF